MFGAGTQGNQVTSGIGFGGAVRYQFIFVGDFLEPFGFLFRGTAYVNRIAAQEGGKYAGGNPQINAGQLFADALNFGGLAAQAAVFFGN